MSSEKTNSNSIVLCEDEKKRLALLQTKPWIMDFNFSWISISQCDEEIQYLASTLQFIFSSANRYRCEDENPFASINFPRSFTLHTITNSIIKLIHIVTGLSRAEYRMFIAPHCAGELLMKSSMNRKKKEGKIERIAFRFDWNSIKIQCEDREKRNVEKNSSDSKINISEFMFRAFVAKRLYILS